MLQTTLTTLAIGLATASVTAAVSVPPATSTATVDPVRLAGARDLVEAMHVGAQMRDMMRPFMMNMMKGVAAGRAAAGAPAPTRAEQERTDGAMSMVADEIGRVVNRAMPQIGEAAASTYARNLTAAEIEGATAFYRTPAGQAILAKQPQIMADMNNATQAVLLKPMMAQMPAIVAKIKAAQGDAPATVPATGK